MIHWIVVPPILNYLEEKGSRMYSICFYNLKRRNELVFIPIVNEIVIICTQSKSIYVPEFEYFKDLYY